jgi:hypothetical protein
VIIAWVPASPAYHEVPRDTPGALNSSQQDRGDMDEVGVHLNLKSGIKRVPDKRGKGGIEGRFPADELDGLHPEHGGLGDEAPPVVEGHGPDPTVRA